MANFITLDTETAGTLNEPIVYDIGFIVHTSTGRVKEKHSYVVWETFFNKQLMETAYYKDKIPQYIEDINNGSRKVMKFMDIQKLFKQVCEEYDVEAVIAHNASFDMKALKNTMMFLSNNEKKYFIPYGIRILDSLKMVRDVLGSNKRYCKFCNDNGYKTKNNQNRYTAEIVYRYISHDNAFIEEHKGLQDCEIEMEITVYCLKARCRRPNKEIKAKLWQDSENITYKDLTIGTLL